MLYFSNLAQQNQNHMSSISDFLNSESAKQMINNISKESGVSKKGTKSVVDLAAPVLLGMLQKNASTSDGASSIKRALQKHDGSILDNLSGLLGSDILNDGKDILGHILGGKQNSLEKSISNKTGVSVGNVSKILAMIAPIVMGYLGKQSKNSSGGGLEELIGSLTKGSSSLGYGGVLTSLLDQDGDGKLGLDDIVGAVSGKKKKYGGLLGGLLGNLFGKK